MWTFSLPCSLILLSLSLSLAQAVDQQTSLRERVLNHRKLILAAGGGDILYKNFLITFTETTDVGTFFEDLSLSQQLQSDAGEDAIKPIKENVLFFGNKNMRWALVEDLPLESMILLLNDDNVRFIEQDLPVELDYVQALAPWHLDYADGDSDWSFRYRYTGAGVDVYVLDSGIKIDHGDFEGRASCGFNAFANTESGCTDNENHGTHVASTIGGKKYGVAKQVNLIAVKVVKGRNGQSGSVSSTVRGIDYVIEQKQANPDRPAVANVSLGTGVSVSLNTALDRAVEAGVIVVTSAGNDDTDACKRSPASASLPITVGSIGRVGIRSGFSNYGSCVSIFAPGENVEAASPSFLGWSIKSGTSMASPMVAGAAAMYLERDPALTGEQVWQEIQSDAATGRVRGGGSGSPNLVLNIDNLNNDNDGRSDGGFKMCKSLFSGCSSDAECCWNCNGWFGICFFF